jgi:hypothetical protein
MNVLTAGITAEGDETKMTTENAVPTHTTAALAAPGAIVAPEKASAKKTSSPKKGAPQNQKSASGGKPKAAAATKSKRVTPAKRSAKGAKAAPAQKSVAAREGSKTAQVVVMMQRKNGATLAEIVDQMGWQKHTVRGFMAGAMKKAGYTVESFKSDKGERTYRINP